MEMNIAILPLVLFFTGFAGSSASSCLSALVPPASPCLLLPTLCSGRDLRHQLFGPLTPILTANYLHDCFNFL